MSSPHVANTHAPLRNIIRIRLRERNYPIHGDAMPSGQGYAIPF